MCASRCDGVLSWLDRAKVLMEFFGYGEVPTQVLNAQRFLWGKVRVLLARNQCVRLPRVFQLLPLGHWVEGKVLASAGEGWGRVA